MEEEPKGALLADLGLPQARGAAVGGGTRVVRLSSGIAVSANCDRPSSPSTGVAGGARALVARSENASTQYTWSSEQQLLLLCRRLLRLLRRLRRLDWGGTLNLYEAGRVIESHRGLARG